MNTLKFCLITVAALAVSNGLSAPKYKGTAFVSLNGWKPGTDCTVQPGDEKLPYLLDHLGDSGIRLELHNTFSLYQKNGINIIRLIIDPNWPCYAFGNEYPTPSPARIKSVNDLMDSAWNHGMKTSITFGPPKLLSGPSAHFFMDSAAPYTQSKLWLDTWMTGLNKSRLALVNLADEIVVFTGGGRDSTNNASWATAMYSWYRSQSYGVPFSFEFFSPGLASGPINGMNYRALSTRFTDVTNWILANTPDVDAASLELYFYLPTLPPSPVAYRDTAQHLLRTYFNSPLYASKHTPLWVDEFGHIICNGIDACCPTTEVSQTHYFDGVLSSLQRYSGSQILGAEAWSSANDLPFDGTTSYGMVSAYGTYGTLTPRPALKNFRRRYYPTPSTSLLLIP